MNTPRHARKPQARRPKRLPPRSRRLLDDVTGAVSAFFLEHHLCGGVVENIVDEELAIISLICRRCDASVMLRLS